MSEQSAGAVYVSLPLNAGSGRRLFSPNMTAQNFDAVVFTRTLRTSGHSESECDAEKQIESHLDSGVKLLGKVVLGMFELSLATRG